MNDQLVLKVLLVSFSLKLLIFRAAAGRKEVFGVRGSSILLDPEYTDDLTHHGIVWAFDGGTGSVINIVDYVPGYYKVQPSKQFQFRLDYNPSNGSLLLKNPQPRDQGVYTFAVDGNWKASVNLRLIEPLSEPVIISKSVNATIELTCQVSSGRPSSILWRTDSDVIESGQHYQLRDNNSTLIISEVSRSDCRIYFCSVENPVSKNTTSYSVDGFGLLQRYYLTKGLSIAVAPAVVTTSIITCRIAFSSNAEKCLPFLKYGLQILVYVFLIALFAYWIAFGETSTIVLVMFVVLCLLLVLTVLLIMASFSRFKDTLKSKTCILTVLGVLATSGEIAVLCLTVSLIAEVTSPGDKGCELAAKLRSNFTIAAYVSIPFLLALILHAILTKWNKRRSRNQPPNLDANNVDGQEKGELIDLGKQKLSSESTVSTEELP